jgi:hypothetical protein
MKGIVFFLALIIVLSWSGPAAAVDGRCSHRGEPGPCKALIESYHYDPGSGTCKEFYWGGCGAIPFKTKEECLQACGGEKPLAIAELKAFPEKRLPYALLHLEYPRDWQKPDFTVQVNGKEVPSRLWGGGHSPDRQYATLFFFPGEGGSLKVSVQASLDGKTHEATDRLRWNVWAMAGLLDGPGRHEAVMKARALRFWAFPADKVRVLFNGRSITPNMEPLSGKPVGLFSIEPGWRAGKNTLSIETTGKDGKAVAAEYSFVYLPDGAIKINETLAIPYGTTGGKSGPFYSMELEGDALISVGDGEETYYIIDPEGWAVEKSVLVKTLKAERPGRSRVKIFVKRHFLQARELEREFDIHVSSEAVR